MLTYLIIRNFAIIDSLELELSQGFTAITGETGAGKSIIVNALHLVLGGRSSVEVVRADAERAVVEAIFHLEGEHKAAMDKALESQGIEVRDEVMIRRVVQRQGRSRAFINGSIVSVGALRELTEGLVDISGQHEHYSLMQPETHVDILDRFCEATELAESVFAGIARLRDLKREVAHLRRTERERLARLDFLSFQLEEIDRSLLDPDMLGELGREMELLRHAEKLREESRQIMYMLYESDRAVSDAVDEACGTLERLSEVDERLGGIVAMLQEASVQFSEAGVELRRYASDIEVNPGRLSQIEEWLHAYRTIERKYGDDFDTIVARAEEMRAELNTIKGAESRISEAQAQHDELQKEVMAQARTLSARRHEAARWLKERIEAELSHLGMERCRFEAQISHTDGQGGAVTDIDDTVPASLNERGLDVVEFVICPNPGMGWGSLARIASGGELSRIMLAIKNALMATDPVCTYIFDEVDSGIGGAVADAVGEKIKVSRSKQVICITHLPQIAAYGDHHLQVAKVQNTGSTTSTLTLLDDDDRIMEIARMLGGRDTTPTTLAHAREMIRSRV